MGTIENLDTYAARIAKAREVMAQEGLDFLVVGPSSDLFYLTGYDAHVSERLNLLIIGKNGEAAMVVPVLEAPLYAGRETLAPTITWTETDTPTEKVAEFIGDATGKKIGVANNLLVPAGFPLDMWRDLEKSERYYVRMLDMDYGDSIDSIRFAPTTDVRGADLERERLMSTSYVCAVAKDHPMADKAVSLEQFAALRHVVVSSRREGRSYIEEVVRAAGYRITPVMRLPHYMPALEIVRQTDMVLTAPAALAAGPGLAALTLDAELPGLETDLYWRRENTEDPALSWLRGLLIRLSRSLPFPASA